MKITIASLFPSLYSEFWNTSILGRAIKNGICDIRMLNMFDFVEQKKRIDSTLVGHGDGMLIGAEVVERVYDAAVSQESKKPYTIFFSPHGKKLDQDRLKDLYHVISNQERDLLLFAGRYEGFDARAEEYYADEILSIGDYVLTGGDLPIMVFLEGLLRLIPGVVGKPGSVENDSFSGTFLDCPHYANPSMWKGKMIPDVLKSGNHALVNEWRERQAINRSICENWEWVRRHVHEKLEKQKIKEALPHHYCVLLHNDVMMPNNCSGTSSVTSIDIHDIARSGATYGIKKYFIVTRLEAQQKIVEKFLSFWHNEDSNKINASRAFALKNVSVVSELSDVLQIIENEEGKKPITVVTSSRKHISHHAMISYHDQGEVWKQGRPVVFIFGTAHGIDPELMNTFDYRLLPIEGLEEFNFLSVRSAVAVIFDRWFGCNNIK